jgi:hypothetical protein
MGNLNAKIVQYEIRVFQPMEDGVWQIYATLMDSELLILLSAKS